MRSVRLERRKGGVYGELSVAGLNTPTSLVTPSVELLHILSASLRHLDAALNVYAHLRSPWQSTKSTGNSTDCEVLWFGRWFGCVMQRTFEGVPNYAAVCAAVCAVGVCIFARDLKLREED